MGGLAPIYWKLGENIEKLRKITCISSGVLLSSAMLIVIPEGFAIAQSGSMTLNPVLLGGAILAGFLVMLILEGSGIGHAVHEEHHDHEELHGHNHIHHQSKPWILVLGLSLHSAADGLAIGSAATATSSAVTALVAFAVLIHKVPAAFSLGVFSLHQRDEKKQAVRDVVLFSLATPLMILLSYYTLQNIDEQIIGFILLFAAGTFLYVATVDTLPDMHNPETGKQSLKFVLIGAGVLAALLLSANLVGLMPHGL
jgi:zinc transporter 9